jgi:integrase
MISDWMEWLHEGRSEVTVNNIRGRMHALMAFGVQLGTIKLNPVSAVPRMVIPKQLDEPENFWEPQEFERFMVTMTDMRYIALFSLMWYTGMRIGEVLALKWKNVDLNKRTISIVENLVYGAQEGTGSYLIVSPKTRNSIRKIDIPAKLYDIMLPWYEHQRKLDGFNENYFVFGDRRALGVASPTYALRRGIEKSGVKRITLHGFRHSHASYLINADIDDRLIAERLGHSVDMLHKVYAHIYKAKRNELKSRLDEIF